MLLSSKKRPFFVKLRAKSFVRKWLFLRENRDDSQFRNCPLYEILLRHLITVTVLFFLFFPTLFNYVPLLSVLIAIYGMVESLAISVQCIPPNSDFKISDVKQRTTQNYFHSKLNSILFPGEGGRRDPPHLCLTLLSFHSPVAVEKRKVRVVSM